MIELTEPQVWTLIGVFSAVLIGMFTIVQTSLLRVLRAEIGGLRTEMKSEIGSLRTEVKSDIATLEARMNSKFDALDRDVQILMRREWDGGSQS